MTCYCTLAVRRAAVWRGARAHAARRSRSRSRNPSPFPCLTFPDLAYDLDTDVGRVGDGYMRQLSPIVSGMPYNMIPGNR